MKRWFCLCLGILLLLNGTACRSNLSTWQEQYDLGVRYLSEGDYEGAIIAFTAAIEIDPKRSEAYLNLANVYVELGDLEAAIGTLETGYEATGSEELFQKLSDLQKNDDKNIAKQFQVMLQAENAVQYSDLPVIMTMSVDDAIRSAGYPPVDQYAGVYHNGDRIFITGNGVNIDWTDDVPTPLAVTYYDRYTDLNDGGVIGFRNIEIADTYETVINKLGLYSTILSDYEHIIIALSKDGNIREGIAEEDESGEKWIWVIFLTEVDEFMGPYATEQGIQVNLHFSDGILTSAHYYLMEEYAQITNAEDY